MANDKKIHKVAMIVDKVAKSGESAHLIANEYPAGIKPIWLDLPLLKQLAPNEPVDEGAWIITVARKADK